MSVVGILFAGLARIREVGWCQGAHARTADGKMYRFDGYGKQAGVAASYSAHGAVAGNDVVDMMYARERLWQALGDGQAGFGNLAAWNDTPERTRAEVIALYEATIAGMVEA